MRRLFGWLILLTLVIAACTAANQSEAMSGDDSRVVQAAKKELAKKLAVSERAISLVGEVEEVTWPDSSLGCPEPGMMYAQVLTPGYRFKLQSGGKIFEYHAGKGAVKLCNR